MTKRNIETPEGNAAPRETRRGGRKGQDVDVRLTTSVAYVNGSARRGDVISVSKAQADSWTERGMAEPV